MSKKKEIDDSFINTIVEQTLYTIKYITENELQNLLTKGLEAQFQHVPPTSNWQDIAIQHKINEIQSDTAHLLSDLLKSDPDNQLVSFLNLFNKKQLESNLKYNLALSKFVNQFKDCIIESKVGKDSIDVLAFQNNLELALIDFIKEIKGSNLTKEEKENIKEAAEEITFTTLNLSEPLAQKHLLQLNHSNLKTFAIIATSIALFGVITLVCVKFGLLATATSAIANSPAFISVVNTLEAGLVTIAPHLDSFVVKTSMVLVPLFVNLVVDDIRSGSLKNRFFEVFSSISGMEFAQTSKKLTVKDITEASVTSALNKVVNNQPQNKGKNLLRDKAIFNSLNIIVNTLNGMQLPESRINNSDLHEIFYGFKGKESKNTCLEALFNIESNSKDIMNFSLKEEAVWKNITVLSKVLPTLQKLSHNNKISFPMKHTHSYQNAIAVIKNLLVNEIDISKGMN